MPGGLGILPARVQVVYTTPLTPLHEAEMATTPSGVSTMDGVERTVLHFLLED